MRARFPLLKRKPGFKSYSMPMRCPKCGAEVEDEWPVCRKCFEPVKRPGFFARLFRKLVPRINVTVSRSSTAIPGFTTSTISLRTNQTFKIRNAKTGELHEYRSLDEVPVELRGLVREAEEQALTGKSASNFSWSDSSGTVHHCNSIDELPPDMREVYQRALAGKPLDNVSDELRDAATSGFSIKKTSKITWKDSSGTLHHCNSPDELPPEIRAVYQKAIGDKDKI